MDESPSSSMAALTRDGGAREKTIHKQNPVDHHDESVTPSSSSSTSHTKAANKLRKEPYVKLESNQRTYSVVKADEKHGLLHHAIPVMPLPVAALFCILNILVPGLGTLCSSFTCFCCGSTRVGRPVIGFALNLLAALLQMLTFFLIVGWIWSILWGMTFVQLSLYSKKGIQSTLPYYVRRQSSVE